MFAWDFSSFEESLDVCKSAITVGANLIVNLIRICKTELNRKRKNLEYFYTNRWKKFLD